MHELIHNSGRRMQVNWDGTERKSREDKMTKEMGKFLL